MADYGRLQLRAVSSKNDDYSNPSHDTGTVIEVTSTPEHVMWSEIPVSVAGMTLIGAGTWTTVAELVVFNLDSTNFVTIGYTDNQSNANSITVPAGKGTWLSDIKQSVAVTLTADTAAVNVAVWATGT